MNINPTRFDEVLDQLVAWKRPEGMACDCPKCKKRPPVQGNWKNRYESFEWSTSKALSIFGLAWITTDQMRAALVKANMTELLTRIDQTADGATDNTGRVWLRENASMPIKTAAHEIAHFVLGHTNLQTENNRRIDMAVKLIAMDPALMEHLDKKLGDKVIAMVSQQSETEAETTALLVVDALNYPDAGDALAWSAHYISGNMPAELLDRAKVKRAAQQIMSAGMIEQAVAA